MSKEEAAATFLTQLLATETYRKYRGQRRDSGALLRAMRRLTLDSCSELLFESAATVAYQVQEVLLIEGIDSEERIAQVVADYAPLLPTADGFGASLMTVSGTGLDARKMAHAVTAGEVRLNLGRVSSTARFVDRDRDDAAVRYLRFDAWFPHLADAPALVVGAGPQAKSVGLPRHLSNTLVAYQSPSVASPRRLQRASLVGLDLFTHSESESPQRLSPSNQRPQR